MVAYNPITPTNGNPKYTLTTTNGTITPVAQAFPALPTVSWPSIPSGTASQNVTGLGWVNRLNCPYTSSDTFPRNGDEDTTGKTYLDANVANRPAPNATYAYSVCKDGNNKSIVAGGSDITLGQSGQETFKFYAAGAVEVASNGYFVPKAGGTTKSKFYIQTGGLKIGGNGDFGIASDVKALQFYVYAQDGGTINNNLVNTSIDIGANGTFFGFVFGPNANAMTGGNGNIVGAVWVKGYNFGGNGSIFQGLSDTTGLDVTIPTGGTVTSYNLGGSPSEWKRCPVTGCP